MLHMKGDLTQNKTKKKLSKEDYSPYSRSTMTGIIKSICLK